MINDNAHGYKREACGVAGKYVACDARRYVSYGSKSVKIFHCGNHTCQVSMKTSGNMIKVKELIKNNPKIKPAEVQNRPLFFRLFEKTSNGLQSRKRLAAFLTRRRLAISRRQ